MRLAIVLADLAGKNLNDPRRYECHALLNKMHHGPRLILSKRAAGDPALYPFHDGHSQSMRGVSLFSVRRGDDGGYGALSDLGSMTSD